MESDQKFMAWIRDNMSHKDQFITFYGERMICVTGLRGY